MRIHYVLAIAASTTGADVPLHPAPMHVTGVYYAAYRMYLPRNANRAADYFQLYEKERRRLKGIFMKESLENDQIQWDVAESGGSNSEGLTRP